MNSSRERTSPRSLSSASRATPCVYSSLNAAKRRTVLGPARLTKRSRNLSCDELQRTGTADPATHSFVILARMDPSSQSGYFIAFAKIWPVARASAPFWSSLISSRTKRRLTWRVDWSIWLSAFYHNETHKVACGSELLVSSVTVDMRAKEFVRSLNKERSLSIGEDVVAVHPSSRLCSCFLVPGVTAVLERADRENIRNSELAC